VGEAGQDDAARKVRGLEALACGVTLVVIAQHDVEQMLASPSFKAAALEIPALLRATSGFRQAAAEVQAYVATHRQAMGR
jgi:hypothetical protein